MGCKLSKVEPVLSKHECCPLCTNKNKKKDEHPFSDYWIRKEAVDFRDNGGKCPKQKNT